MVKREVALAVVQRFAEPFRLFICQGEQVVDLEFKLAMIGSIREVKRRGERCDGLIGLAAA